MSLRKEIPNVRYNSVLEQLPEGTTKKLYALTEEKHGQLLPNWKKISMVAKHSNIDFDEERPSWFMRGAGKRVNPMWFAETFQGWMRDPETGTFPANMVEIELGNLIENRAYEPLQQDPIKVSNVKSIIDNADSGFLQTWTLWNPIQVGAVYDILAKAEFREFALFPVSGRHRITAIHTMLEALGIAYADIRKMKVMVEVRYFQNVSDMGKYIRLANQSRTMDKSEVQNLAIQVSQGVDTAHDAGKLADLVLSSKSKTDTKRAFVSFFRCLYRSSVKRQEVFKLAPTTLVDVASAVYSQLFDGYKTAKEGAYTATGRPVYDTHYPRFVLPDADAVTAFGAVVDGTLRYLNNLWEGGNFAREYKQYVPLVVEQLTEIFEGDVETPVKPGRDVPKEERKTYEPAELLVPADFQFIDTLCEFTVEREEEVELQLEEEEASEVEVIAEPAPVKTSTPLRSRTPKGIKPAAPVVVEDEVPFDVTEPAPATPARRQRVHRSTVK